MKLNWKMLWYVDDPKMGQIPIWRYVIIMTIIWSHLLLDWLFKVWDMLVVQPAIRVKHWWWDLTIPGLRRLRKLAGIK